MCVPYVLGGRAGVSAIVRERVAPALKALPWLSQALACGCVGCLGRFCVYVFFFFFFFFFWFASFDTTFAAADARFASSVGRC